MSPSAKRWLWVLAILFSVGAVAIHNHRPPAYGLGTITAYYAPPCSESALIDTLLPSISDAPDAPVLAHARVVSLVTLPDLIAGKEETQPPLEKSQYAIIALDNVLSGNADLTKYSVVAASPHCLRPLHIGDIGFVAGRVAKIANGLDEFVLAPESYIGPKKSRSARK